MNVKALIEHLKTLPEDNMVLVRIEDPCGGPDYYHLEKSGIKNTDVMDENGNDVDAVTIGDDRV